MLTLSGGPVAPSGETLAAGTRLVIQYHEPYRDSSGVYPVEHVAALDVTNGTWKPVGAADGTAFALPAASYGGQGPLATLEERQVHADGSEVTSERTARLVETGVGTGILLYADLPAAFPLAGWVSGLNFQNPSSAQYLGTII